MKHTLLCIFTSVFITSAFADTYVRGYHRKDGTYVEPHYRTNPDSRKDNNYSNGAYNPHKGY